MQSRRLASTAAALVAALAFTAPVAHAQTAPVPATAPASPTSVTWQATAGYGWFALRDIARTSTPVDASPVEWRGTGFVIDATHARATTARLHRFDFAAAWAGDFEYRTAQASIGRPSADHANSIDGRYEYRRYFFTDLFVQGLDVGVGAQGLAQYLSLSRHVDTGITGHDAAFSFGPAAVAAARFRRWSRVQAEVAWANGMVLSRFRHEHSENASVSSTWGGGWLTHLMLQADIRLTRRASLAVRYFTAGEGLVSDHWNVAIARGSISAGVVYAK